MDYLEDDDIHFCLRCRRTILGLGAYVEHRSQKNCHLQQVVNSENSASVPVASTSGQDSLKQLIAISTTAGNLVTAEDAAGQDGVLNSDVDPSLKADDFFSLLELQSSTKSGSSCPTAGIVDLSLKDQKCVGTGVVTRSKRRGVESKVKETCDNSKKVVGRKRVGRGKKINKIKESLGGKMENVVVKAAHQNTLKDGINTGFVVNQNKDKESLVGSVEVIDPQYASKDRVDSTSFAENQVKLVGEVREILENTQEDPMKNEEIAKNTDKVFPELFSDFPPSDTSFSFSNLAPIEEVIPFEVEEQAITDDEEEEEEDEVDMFAPPRSYGGKWKPGSSPSIHQQRSDSIASVSWTDQEATNSLMSITGNSWRMEPSTSSDLGNKPTVTQKQGSSSIPPPGHTRGKWLPSSNNEEGAGAAAQRTGNRVQYWCGVCNRRLSSRGLYERHLMSPLHARRTRHERQLDEDYLQHRAAPTGEVASRRPRRLPRKLQEAIAGRMVVRGVKAPVKKGEKKNRSKTIQCEVCDLQVARHQIGKHLVSRFHLRRAAAEPDAARQMIQSHAIAVARQAPFRCAPCRFYCNTLDSMMFHWNSQMHNDRDAEVPGRYWCAFCKHFSDTSAGMAEHLRSDQHKEVVNVVNKSFPIEIQKLVTLKCDEPGCERIFRYNSQLRQHARLTGHVQSSGSASDSYQDRVKCCRCSFVANSQRRLQEHMAVRHKVKNFFCSDCKMKFDSKEDAVLHRRSEAHRYTVVRMRKPPHQRNRACAHCFEILSDVLALKEHLSQMHPDKAHRCAKCGKCFTLRQELSRHVRFSCRGLPEKSASHDDVTTPSTSEASASSESSCPKCAYKSSSKSELLFHVALHGDPIHSKKSGKEGTKPEVPKFACPTCSRWIRKDCLHNHLKTHTGEKCHVCRKCGAAFARADALVRHRRVVHTETMRCTLCDVICANAFTLRRHLQSHDEARQKSHHCAECGMAFYDKTSLKQHLQTHTGKTVECHYADCVFTCRSVSELSNHLRTHSDLRLFSCELCDYSAKTKPQLARHLKTHSADQDKEYKCSECDFKTNNSTHLKRHTRLHSGAKPYHCPHCSYTCNLQENLRKHVLSTKKHKGKFLYTCQEAECNFESNSAKDFRVHLVQVHGQKATAVSSYITSLHRFSDEGTMQEVTNSNSNNPGDSLLSQSLSTTSPGNILSPLLGSAVPLPLQDDPVQVNSEPPTSSDDIIFIQIPSSDTAYDVPFFSPNEHQLFFETLPTSSSAHAQSVQTCVEQEFVIIDETTTIELVSEDE